MNNKNEGLMMKYFVLSPKKDNAYGKASRKAILKYAEIIYEENPNLGGELITWVGAIEGDIVVKKIDKKR